MLIDNHLQRIEGAQSTGAIVLLKWDGERTGNFYTVVIDHHEKGYNYRRDSSDMGKLIGDALDDYEMFLKSHTAP